MRGVTEEYVDGVDNSIILKCVDFSTHSQSKSCAWFMANETDSILLCFFDFGNQQILL